MFRARQLAAPVVVITAVLFGAVMGFYVRPSAKQRTDPNWPTEAPTRVTISRPDEHGRKAHILNVVRCDESRMGTPTPHESGPWRVILSTPQGVWMIEAEHVEDVDG